MVGSFQDLAARLTIPGLPEWSGVAALVALLLVALAYLLMPFSVFGVKGRLDALEAQLDEIRDEIRGLSIRMSDSPRRAAAAEDWVEPPRTRGEPWKSSRARARPSRRPRPGRNRPAADARNRASTGPPGAKQRPCASSQSHLLHCTTLRRRSVLAAQRHRDGLTPA